MRAYSPKKQTFQSLSTSMNLKPKVLLYDVKTCGNLAYYMLRDCVPDQEAIIYLVAQNYQYTITKR